MTEVEELKIKLEEVHEKYNNLIDLRVELLDNGRLTELMGDGVTLYAEEESRLYEESEEIKNRLADLDPVNFYFGKGHGCFRCYGCKGLFDAKKANDYLKATSKKKTGGRKKREDEKHFMGTFLRCEFHEGLKSMGQMRLKKEEMVWS